MSRRKEAPLSHCVRQSLETYFENLNGERPTGIYQLVLNEMERPLLEVVMKQAESNQTRAANMLGINRNTLRKKLKTYGLD